jgi:hypothetical protein
MRIATLTFVSHLQQSSKANRRAPLFGEVLSYLKMLRTAARKEKKAARGVLVCSRCAARRGAVL